MPGIDDSIGEQLFLQPHLELSRIQYPWSKLQYLAKNKGLPGLLQQNPPKCLRGMSPSPRKSQALYTFIDERIEYYRISKTFQDEPECQSPEKVGWIIAIKKVISGL